ncbi:hypothetical protein FQA39_LY05124 [Lamprigera yunnana]|nr:hypothetical protein FQA39_LY05124 [Lamprigera yunnana]
MGVRGLTTFIAHRSDSYLRNYRLHDTYLVIDGNSIAANLYQNHRRNDCFGGDYDKYEGAICRFFDVLLQCNITPLIVLDGAYEKKKLRTVFDRLKNKVKTFKMVNSVNQHRYNVFPLFVRDIFVEVILKLGLKIVRCDFEADYEIACLAKTLNCPLLSYDSDFFIFDVLYIPFVSLKMSPQRLTNGFYLSCQLYEMEYFLKAYGNLDKSIVPVMAALLGNDYINKNVFSSFYASLKLTKRKRLQNASQRCISSLIKWLRNESYESAIAKILHKLPQNKKRRAAHNIKMVAEGYVCKKSSLLKDFGLEANMDQLEFTIDTEKILKQSEAVSEEFELSLEYGSEDEEQEEEEEKEDEDDDSEEDMSDTDMDIDEDSYDKDVIPAWFKKKFRKCCYPTAFMDILVRNIYFCTPQLENYSNTCSHLTCVQIIAAFNKILRSESETPLIFVARHQSTNVKKFETPNCDISLPTLNSLKNVTLIEGRTYLFEVLELNSEVLEVIANVPEHWQLYILAIIYWINNASPNVTYSYVYSIILCMIMIQTANSKPALKFLAKYKNKLNIQNPQNTSDNSFLNTITKEESSRCHKDLVKYFEMDEKMKHCTKLYDINVMHCLSKFQTSLLHIKYLNSLLNKPFNNSVVSEFYNDAYLDTLLRLYPTILKCLKTIVNILLTVTSENVYDLEVKRRRRKRKKSSKITVSSDDSCEEEEVTNEDDKIVADKNNPFSLLNFV